MADLIAIGYPDEATAFAAADEARRLAADLIIQPDAIAVIARDKDGSYHVTTSHHPMTKGASWGLFWGFLFGLLFFIPVFGMAVGAGLGALMGKFAKTSIDRQFQDQVRDMVQPGTSALFLMLEKVTPDNRGSAKSRLAGGGGYRRSGAVTPSRPRPLARTIRAASASHSRARPVSSSGLSSRGSTRQAS